MIDLHHHLLPGLDDGSPDLETSVAMARMAAGDGITAIVATPHASHRYPFSPERVAERLSALQKALQRDGVTLQVASGCDFHLSYDNIQDALKNPRKYTLNNTEYLLVELPDNVIPPQLTEAFHELRVAGMTPILTHPERNPSLQRDDSQLREWMRQGMLVQITTSSVLGQMGKAAERMSLQLLADRWVHFLATDAHNVTSRPPKMRAAQEFVAKKYGAEYARSLCVTNPAAVFAGLPMPVHVPAQDLHEDLEDKPWWKRLLGK